MSEGRGPAGPDPLSAPVVTLVLLLEPLLEEPAQLLQGQGFELGQLLLIQNQPVNGILEPVQDLLGDLDVGLDVAEAGHKGLIELVVKGLALDQKGPGEVIEDIEGAQGVALVQGLGQGQPLGDGDRDLEGSEKVEELQEEGPAETLPPGAGPLDPVLELGGVQAHGLLIRPGPAERPETACSRISISCSFLIRAPVKGRAALTWW